MPLADIIISKIGEQGPISFHGFMEMCLYHPQGGYYTSGVQRIGTGGDYYTSPALSSVFGQMLARQIEEMWRLLDEEVMCIVEYEAGTGSLCLDILDYFKTRADSLPGHIEYYIIERNGIRPAEQSYESFATIKTVHDIAEIGNLKGCVISNEMIDNIPVHVVVMEEELMEVFVDYKNGFTEVLRPATARLKNYFKEQNIVLPHGYRTEINLQALEWIEEVASSLIKGFVITVDYGFSAAELYSGKRSSGTLACYYKHSVSDFSYANIGEQDITAHVNFSALKIYGQKYGLDFTGFCNQNFFLRSLGVADYLRIKEKEEPPGDKKELFSLNKLLLDMGSSFRVLIQQKGVNACALSGLRFPQPLH